MNSFMSQSASSDFHSSSNGINHNITEQRLTTDQILQLMNNVATSVKNNDFSANLASNVFLLCQQLKVHGQHLEQNHKSELNRCFVALRQACCRDSGQLGTPCRLKMMEIVELRAMGWRPNLAHTQYYLNRTEHQPTQSPVQAPQPQQSPAFSSNVHSPFNQYNVQQSQQPIFVPSDITPTSSAPQVPPGYFFIPATAPGWQNQMITSHPGGIMGAPPQTMIDPWAATRNAAAAAAAAAALMGGNLGKTNAALGLKTPKIFGNMSSSLTGSVNPKSNKSAQFREEVTIRNCDSGKIMGVKGRRVAVVEELSKTVISFQKVDPKSKDRILTITGSSDESIQYAKKLIEDTIRRNISPNRFNEDNQNNRSSAATSPPASAPISSSQNVPNEEEDDEEDSPGISIETAQDGTLKLCCDDPDVLQAAQAALSEYLNRARRGNRMSAEERAEKKERRKSMPLQTNQPKEEEKPAPTIKATRRAFTGSTPNLAASLADGLTINNKPTTNNNNNNTSTNHKTNGTNLTKYSREELLQIREGSEGTEPSNLQISDNEILKEISKKDTNQEADTNGSEKESKI